MRRNEKKHGPVRLIARRPVDRDSRRGPLATGPALTALPEEALPGRLLILVSKLHRREQTDPGEGRR